MLKMKGRGHKRINKIKKNIKRMRSVWGKFFFALNFCFLGTLFHNKEIFLQELWRILMMLGVKNRNLSRSKFGGCIII